MGLYKRLILPRLIAWGMRTGDLMPYRRRLVPRASGRVLEVGVGSGLNLPLYSPDVTCVIGLDPSPLLLRRATVLARETRCPVHLIQAAAEAIPLANQSVDTVVMTWTLCSVQNAQAGLRDIRRVLHPAGQLLFVEHGLAPEPRVAAWQHRLDPLWNRLSCHLDNPVERLLSEAGFETVELHSGHLDVGPKVLTFIYEGVAQPAP
jgi:ubiquinone/menaquinone biosynthesis C-methylase UbiE